MTCYSPTKAYYGPKTKEGKNSIVWKKGESWEGKEINLPCYKCIGCTEERARQWGVRCMHEVSLHKDNCFITLTYDDNNLPSMGEVQLSHFQEFMKRLRKKNVPKNPMEKKTPEWAKWQQEHGIRFYHSAEYGEEKLRPHYHALLFNHDFSDKVYLREEKGNNYYTSQQLSELWPYGHHVIGAATFGSANYIARYVNKKVGKSTDKVRESGLKPEYSTMSRRPGIGKGWYDKYKTDVYPSDEVISGGQSSKPPRFYDNQLDKDNPELLKSIKKKREKEGNRQKLVIFSDGKKMLINENDSFRLPVREKVHEAKIGIMPKTHWR